MSSASSFKDTDEDGVSGPRDLMDEFSKADIVAGAPESNGKKEDPVKTHIGKLNLWTILTQTKKGVQKFHASEYVKKADRKETLALRCHLQLVEHAEALACQRITMTDQELRTAVEALQQVLPRWPLGLQARIVERAFRQHIQNEQQGLGEKQVETMLEFARPVEKDEGAQPLDLLAPVVRKAPWSVETRVAKFQKFILADILVGQMLRGEKGSPSVALMCTKGLQFCKMELLAEIPEPYAKVLASMQCCFEALEAVTSSDIGKMLQGINDVEQLKSAFNPASETPVSKVSQAFLQEEFWKGKAAALHDLTSALQVHKEDMAEVEKFLTGAEGIITESSLDQTVSHIQRLAGLEHGLPEKPYAALNKSMLSWCQRLWKHFIDENKEGERKVDMQKMEQFVAECHIHWPLDAAWEKARETLVTMQQAMKGTEKLEAVAAVLENLQGDLTTGDQLEARL